MPVDETYGYGLWPLVVIYAVRADRRRGELFPPRTGRDWRVMRGFTAFAVALFTERTESRPGTPVERSDRLAGRPPI